MTYDSQTILIRENGPFNNFIRFLLTLTHCKVSGQFKGERIFGVADKINKYFMASFLFQVKCLFLLLRFRTIKVKTDHDKLTPVSVYLSATAILLYV